jgi:hypothetical protein
MSVCLVRWCSRAAIFCSVAKVKVIWRGSRSNYGGWWAILGTACRVEMVNAIASVGGIAIFLSIYFFCQPNMGLYWRFLWIRRTNGF